MVSLVSLIKILNINPTEVEVSLPAAMVSISEDKGDVQMCATLSAMEVIQRDFTIQLFTNDGTGIKLIASVEVSIFIKRS